MMRPGLVFLLDPIGIPLPYSLLGDIFKGLW